MGEDRDAIELRRRSSRDATRRAGPGWGPPIALALAVGCGSSTRPDSTLSSRPPEVHPTATSLPSTAPPAPPPPAHEPEPPAFTRVRGRAPEAERTLERLARLMADPAVTALGVAEIYGAVTPVKPARTDLVIEEPFPDATKLTLRRKRVQNRQYITSLEVTFRLEVAPTIRDVVARLGERPPTGAVRLGHHCSHGPCPTYRTAIEIGGVAVDAILYVHVQGPVFDGRLLAPMERSGDPAQKRVRALRLAPPYELCPQGEALSGSERITLTAPATQRDRLLVSGIEATAEAMAREPVDAGGIERALGVTMPRGEDQLGRLELPIGLEPHATLLAPHLEVRWWANAMSDHGEVSLAVIDDAIPPLALAGLRYVEDPARICRLHYDGEHLFEPSRPPDSAHDVVVRVRVRRPLDGGPAHLHRVEVHRAPREPAR